jgi:hypothetical protein
MTDQPFEPDAWTQFYADILAGRPASITIIFPDPEE